MEVGSRLCYPALPGWAKVCRAYGARGKFGDVLVRLKWPKVFRAYGASGKIGDADVVDCVHESACLPTGRQEAVRESANSLPNLCCAAGAVCRRTYVWVSSG